MMGCPHAPAPRAVYVCEHCGVGICEGHLYVTVDGDRYHLDCLEDMSTRELLAEVFNIEIETAEEDIYDEFI